MADLREDGTMVEATAGDTLSGHKAVAIVSGEAVHADKDNAAHRGLVRGVTTGAVIDGEIALIQTYGPMLEPSWTWTPNQPIYCGTNGTLTQTVPTSGWLQQIATADTATLIFIDPKPVIVL